MNEIKSLADQLRNKINQPIGSEVAEGKLPGKQTAKIKPSGKSPPEIPTILIAIREYDNTGHKNLVHVRFDEKMAQTLNHFKMATGTDITKLVAYSVTHLFEQHPELKEIIKQFIQNLDI